MTDFFHNLYKFHCFPVKIVQNSRFYQVFPILLNHKFFQIIFAKVVKLQDFQGLEVFLQACIKKIKCVI